MLKIDKRAERNLADGIYEKQKWNVASQTLNFNNSSKRQACFEK